MAGGAAAYAAAVARATKASGVIVRITPGDFSQLLERIERPLVVVAQGGVFRKHIRYLVSYKGLAFFTRSDVQLVLPRGCETVIADKIWVPE
jgi:hypothetical protein